MNNDIKKCVEVLRAGGLILYPTDTIWGIGCDATNAEAVRKVYDLKRRSDSKSMLVLIDEMGKIQSYVREIPDVAWDLTEISEKPITIIYPEAMNLADNLVAEDGSVGIRVTRETFSHQLCRQFRRPIVSTSANISGEPSPACFDEISEEILNGVDYVVEYRRDDHEKKVPSSIIKFEKNGTFAILRK